MVIALTEVQPYSNGEYLLQKYAASHHGSTVLELLQSLDSLQILYTIGLRRNKTFDSYIHNILHFFLLPCFSFYLIFVCLMFILHLLFYQFNIFGCLSYLSAGCQLWRCSIPKLERWLSHDLNLLCVVCVWLLAVDRVQCLITFAVPVIRIDGRVWCHYAERPQGCSALCSVMCMLALCSWRCIRRSRVHWCCSWEDCVGCTNAGLQLDCKCH